MKNLLTELIAKSAKTDGSVNENQQNRDEDGDKSDRNEGEISDANVTDDQEP